MKRERERERSGGSLIVIGSRSFLGKRTDDFRAVTEDGSRATIVTAIRREGSDDDDENNVVALSLKLKQRDDSIYSRVYVKCFKNTKTFRFLRETNFVTLKINFQKQIVL